MRGDAYGKTEQHLHGGQRRHNDGMLTPIYTPSAGSILQSGSGAMTRSATNGGCTGSQPILYQRQGSNESGKGSYSSDKELGGGGNIGLCNGFGGGAGGAISVANPIALHR